MPTSGLIFGDLPSPYGDYEGARWVVLPIPYDGTSTWGKGADRGPAALLDASANMELYDIATRSEPYRCGIHTARPVERLESPEAMVEEARSRTRHFLEEGKRVLSIGGEHSVSIGPITAYHEVYNDLTVLQIDAHTDLRNEYEGSPYNHACVMARAQDLGPTVQVGIRSMDSSELERAARSTIFYAHQIQQDESWMDYAVDALTDRVYITIDLDGFDPSIIPATGTPEPGGLAWYPTLRFLERVFMERQVVGADIVELCPNKHSHPSNFAAARLAYHLIGYDVKRNPIRGV